MKEDHRIDESRRKVLSVGATGMAALALSTRVSQAQPNDKAKETPKTPGIKLIERDVTYRSGDTDIRAFWVEPTPRPRAAVIVIHEIFGLNAHIRDVARRFARQGYLALAPDLYTREGAPNLDTNNRAAMMEFIAAIPDARMVGDLEAAVVYLNAQDASRVGSVGFCMGGLYSYLLACKSEKLNCAVDFYGRIVYAQTTANKPESPLDLAPQLKCPLLCHFGETDTGIPVADVEKLREELKKSPQTWKVNIYPGAGHAFFNDTRSAHHPAAAADAGTETLAFFKKYLKAD